MKRWFSRLISLDIRVDLFTLTLGLFLIWGYIYYGAILFTKDSPVLNIWANIATDLIGVWLSVRIIDSLLQSREKFHNVRRTTVGNLIYFLRSAQDLTPEFYEWRVRSLRNELRWFEEKLPKRRKYLYRDEYDDVLKTIEAGRKLVEDVQSYMEMFQKLEDLEDGEIEKSINQINEKREKVREQLNQIIENLNKLKFSDSQEKVELEKCLKNINIQTLNSERLLDSFSKKDRTKIETFIQNVSLLFQGSESANNQDFAKSFSEIDLSDIDEFRYNTRIWLHEIADYKEVEQGYRRFRRRKDNYQPDTLRNVLRIAKEKYGSDGEDFLLASTLGEYFDMIDRLVSLRVVIDDEVSCLEQLVENVKSNIWEESGAE